MDARRQIMFACGLAAATALAAWPAIVSSRALSTAESRHEVLLELAPPVAPKWRWGTETAAFIAARLDENLRSLPHTGVQTVGLPPLPTSAASPAAERWTVTVRMEGPPDGFTVVARACPATSNGSTPCLDAAVSGSRDTPWESADTMASALADGLDIAALSVDQVPRDRYAALMLGRSAATLMGWLPRVPTEAIGDRRADPVARATWIDPRPTLGWSLRARDALSRADSDAAIEALTRRSASGHPDHVADLAIILHETDHLSAASAAWGTIEPTDRWPIARLRSAAVAGDPTAVHEHIAALPPALREHPETLAVVALHLWQVAADPDRSDMHRDRAAREANDLLRTWAHASPNDPAPVAAMAYAALADGTRSAELPDLASTLAQRGNATGAALTIIAAAVDDDDPTRAVEAARSLPEGNLRDAVLADLTEGGHRSLPTPKRTADAIADHRRRAGSAQAALDALTAQHNEWTASSSSRCVTADWEWSDALAAHRDELIALRGQFELSRDGIEHPMARHLATLSLDERALDDPRPLDVLRRGLDRQAATSLELEGWWTDQLRCWRSPS